MSIWFCVVIGQTCLLTEDYIGFGDISFIQIKSVLYFEDSYFVARLVDWSNERWAAWPTRGGSCPLWSAGDAGERSDRSGPTVPQSHTTQSHHGRTEGRTQCNDSQHFVNCNPRSQPPCQHQHTCRLKMKKDTKFCGSDNAGRFFLQIALILSFCSGTNCIGLENFWDQQTIMWEARGGLFEAVTALYLHKKIRRTHFADVQL